MKKTITYIGLFMVMVGFILIVNQRATNKSRLSGVTMGTTYTIDFLSDKAELHTIQQQVNKILHDLNQTMSTYIPNSELSLLNQNSSMNKIILSDELYDVIKTAQQISIMSNGAFDVTVSPLLTLWGFGAHAKQPQTVPSQQQIEDVMATIGYDQLILYAEDKSLKKLNPNIHIDLSAIAKGYGVDRIAAYLDTLNIDHYLVEIGGDIKAKGHNEYGQAWQIGIERPDPSQRSLQRTLPLHNMSIASSGNYRQFFRLAEHHYSHIINPHTGKPIQHNTVAVSVLSPVAMDADGLATAFMVLDNKKAISIADQHNIPILIYTKVNNTIHELMSVAMTQYLNDHQ